MTQDQISQGDTTIYAHQKDQNNALKRTYSKYTKKEIYGIIPSVIAIKEAIKYAALSAEGSRPASERLLAHFLRIKAAMTHITIPIYA